MKDVRVDLDDTPSGPDIRFDLFSLFPGMFAGPFSESIIRRAADRGIIDIQIHDIRE